MTSGEELNIQQGGNGSTSQVHLDEPAPKADAFTAEGLGVDPALFDKYAKQDTKEFDWASYGKEVAWQAKQKAGKTGESATAGETAKASADAPAEDKPAAAPSDAAAEKAVADAGLNMEDVNKAILDTGKLTEDQYAAFQTKGIDKDTVDFYIDSMKDFAQTRANDLLKLVGGQDGFENVRAWAQANLSDAERAEYQKGMMKREGWRPIVVDLLSRAGLPQGGVTAPPKAPAENPAHTPGAAITPYKNSGEMIRDQQDPRYKTDPGFQAMVVRRAAASNFGGQGSRMSRWMGG